MAALTLDVSDELMQRLQHSAATQIALPRLSLHESLAVLQSMPQAA